MAKLHNPTVGLLLTVLLLLQDAYGDPAVFSTKGGAATLPCANVQYGHQDCSSTTWIYSRNSSTAAVEKVTLGKIRPENPHRAERLSLLPNCSLHITDVTTEDAGLYTCQQYPNGQKYGEDARVHLSVLHTASRLAGNGLDVIIFCLLNIFDGCNSLGQDMHLNLQWLNEKGVVQENSDNVMIGRVTQCDINLTLKHPVLIQRTWRCQLTAGGHVQASVSHTIGETTRPTPKRTTTTTITTTSTTTTTTTTLVFTSQEAAIRLSIFSMVLIVPGLIGTVHLVRRRKQTCRDACGNPTVFSTKGGAATLPCANVQYGHRNCSSTTWIYSRNRSTAAVEEVTLGKIRPDNTHRAERLSLLPNCSLHITDVTTEDAGLYTCQQYPNGQKYGEDAQVPLFVLHTASRLAGNGLDVIIFCLLNIFDDCNSLGQDMHLNLHWLNEKGVVQGNSDNVMIGRVTQCDINLTLKHPVLTQRTWRCQLTAGGHVQASVSHTIGETTRSTQKRTTTTVTTTSTTTKATTTTTTAVAAAAPTTATSQQTSFPFILISAVVAGLAVCLIIIFLVVRRNRTREKSSGGGETPQQNTLQGVADANRSSTVQPSVVSVESGDEKEPGDVTYAALAHHPRTQALPPATQHEDSVTYATVHIMHKD
ncbi:uncharacterized protein LOC143109441 [Alosa pseudoharengus]|uniref:uncharacterized protein LOC143109441 n=1 Tax=Alosa pseudoharengus TaxID=34774 RepID=UPI003F8903A4